MSYIVATSGGFLATDNSFVMQPGATFIRALELTGKTRPRVLFIMTASGDDAAYLTRSYRALSDYSCDVEHLALFPMPSAPVAEAVGRADLIWVGGGSVANLLAVWQLHGLADEMKNAWEAGTVLAGVSAGSICWHIGGTTDSFGPNLQPVFNGLGLLPYGNGVHYDSEAQRRPLLHSLVGSGELPLSYATDDRIGIVYQGIEPIEVVSDVQWTAEKQPAAYRIETVGGAVEETRLVPGRL